MADRSDFFVPEVMADAVQGALAGKETLAGTGAFTIVPSLPEYHRAGDTVNVPYFSHLGELETRTDGQALTVVDLTSTKETATVVRAGKATEITNWAQQAAAGDPYAEISRQFAGAVMRQYDRAALAAASASTLSLSRVGAVLGYDDLVDLFDLFGDEQDDVVALAMHSKVLARVRKIKDSANRPVFVDAVQGGQPMVLGRPVFVTDRATVNPVGGGTGPDIPTYRTVAIKRGAGVIWAASTPNVDTDKDILTDSRVAAINMYYAAHLYTRFPGQSKRGAAWIETQA